MHRADEKRRRAESDLADKEMRYRELFDYSQGLICIHDLDGVLSTVNRAASQMLGYSENEIIGRNLGDLMPIERRPLFEAYLRQIMHEGLAERLLELKSKSGKPVMLKYHNVLATEEGKEPYILGHAQDVTELLEAQKHLKNLSPRGRFGSDQDPFHADKVRRAKRRPGCALGGDEFVILTIGSQDENAEMMLERIEKCLDEFNEYGGKPYKIACSVGIAPIYPESAKNIRGDNRRSR